MRSKWSKRLGGQLEWNPGEVYRVPTADGARIALGRYFPAERKWVQPVVLAHGLGTNRFALDFDERYSLARHLARRGFETWVLELRGRGVAGRSFDSSFDEQAEHDVAAALRAVLSAQTEAKEVLWVGHSKGGLLAYAHLGRFPGAPFRAIAAMGTPVSFAHHQGVRNFLKLVKPVLQLPVIPLRLATRPVVPFGLPPEPVGPYLVNAANMEPDVIHQSIAHVSADVLGGVARQFARWVERDVFDSNEGFDYRKGMANVRAPLLLLAGERDLLAPYPAVAHARTLVSGPSEVHLLGKSAGLSEDYGHGDLSLGARAPDEVFPRVAEFFERHADRA